MNRLRLTGVPARGAVAQVHLDRPDSLLGVARDGAPLRVLVRLHDRPLGYVDLDDGPAGHPDPVAVLARIRSVLGPAIADHLRADGLAGDPAELAELAELADQAPDDAPCRIADRIALADPPTVSVVIATRDRPDSLDRCLTSVTALDYPRFEVVVVDSAPSDDAAYDVVRRHDSGTAENLRYVRATRPGLAVAHNHGVAAAGGEIVAFTDDDVTVDEQWLTALAATFRRHDSGCVTGLIVPAELATPAQTWLEDNARFGKGFRERVFPDPAATGDEDPLFPYAAGSFGSGANMAFRADVLRTIGGFDAALGAGTRARGGDDLDAFFRVLSTGHRLTYQPAAIVVHSHRPGYAALRRTVHGYGVGLGAYLASTVWQRPATLAELALRVPAGIAHFRRIRGVAPGGTGAPGAAWPWELRVAEATGLAWGPVAYALSRRRAG